MVKLGLQAAKKSAWPSGQAWTKSHQAAQAATRGSASTSQSNSGVDATQASSYVWIWRCHLASPLQTAKPGKPVQAMFVANGRALA